jgi:hypothetical protein
MASTNEISLFTFLYCCTSQLQKKATEELDRLQNAKEITFAAGKKPTLSISEYLEHWHEKHFNAVYHRDFGLESIRLKTRLKKATTDIYRINSWEE